jgi:hypothetical protein
VCHIAGVNRRAVDLLGDVGAIQQHGFGVEMIMRLRARGQLDEGGLAIPGQRPLGLHVLTAQRIESADHFGGIGSVEIGREAGRILGHLARGLEADALGRVHDPAGLAVQ